MEQLSSQLSNYFWSLKRWKAHIKCVVIPTPFTWFGCKYPQIKAQSLHLKHILIVSFQIHCGVVQSWNTENCVNVQIFMDLTVIIIIIMDYIYIALCLDTQSASQWRGETHLKPPPMCSTHLGDARQPFCARTLTTHQLEVEREGIIEPITLGDD